MVLRLEDKKAIVAEIAEIAAISSSAVAAEYRGLTVQQMSALRKNARKSGVYMRIVRNTLTHRALENTNFACMQNVLSGPLVLAFSKEEPGAAAKLMRDFSKLNEKLIIKALSIDGKILQPADINLLADLPTKDQALALILSVIEAPVVKLARTLRETHAKLVRTFAALHRQKEGSI